MIHDMKRQGKRSKMDIAPLIDVVFLLLIFFMLTFAIQGEGIDISIPEGQGSEDQIQEDLTIKIEKDHTLKVNNKIVPLEMLQKTLEQHINARRDKTVAVEAHQKTNYDLFTKVLDISRLAGVEGFSIIK